MRPFTSAFALAMSVILGCGFPAQAQTPQTPSTPSAAMAQAESNRALMKRAPQVRTPVEPDYPESERVLGHAGWVTVRGIVGVDGKMTEAVILRSSAGPVLEASALASAKATVFTPAKDAAGVSISVPVSFPIEFSKTGLDPRYIMRTEPAYPEEERLAGHFGKVVIGGKIGPDGRLVDPVVKVSSRAPGLDAAAMAAAAASEFRPFRDGGGAPISVPVEIPFSFDSYHSPGQGGGILRYRCDQFARDETWWRSVWPAETNSELYTMFVGIKWLAMSQLKQADPKLLKPTLDDLKVRWAVAVEACRAKPDALLIDVLKPEGDWARRLAL